MNIRDFKLRLQNWYCDVLDAFYILFFKTYHHNESRAERWRKDRDENK